MNCVAKVKSEILKLGDVQSADVQLRPPQATIIMSRHIPTATLQQAIATAGNYSLEETNHEMIDDPGMTTEVAGDKTSYLPIVLIFAYIAGVATLVQLSNNAPGAMTWMRHFMAGFFLVFSFFKLMNLKGFAEGYSTYDIVAKRFSVWGFAYPFVELALGVLLLTGAATKGTTIATFLIMGVSSIGVIQSLVKKQKIQCACLGTVIRLPLSKVTLFEDLLMVVMSLVMIILL